MNFFRQEFPLLWTDESIYIDWNRNTLCILSKFFTEIDGKESKWFLWEREVIITKRNLWTKESWWRKFSSINSHLRNSLRFSSLSLYIYILLKLLKREETFDLSNQLNLARFIWNDLPFDHHLLFRFEVGDGFIDAYACCRRQCGASRSLHFTHAEADYVSSLRDTKTPVIVLFRTAKPGWCIITWVGSFEEKNRRNEEDIHWW